MADSSGLDLLPALLQRDPKLRVAVLTGYGSIGSAVEAIQRGAWNYLPKPADADDVVAALRRDHAPIKASAHEGRSPSSSLARAEWEHIQRILADCNGNISETARRLAITRRTLQLKLKKGSAQA
jgi:two-component system response regulator RegA